MRGFTAFTRSAGTPSAAGRERRLSTNPAAALDPAQHRRVQGLARHLPPSCTTGSPRSPPAEPDYYRWTQWLFLAVYGKKRVAGSPTAPRRRVNCGPSDARPSSPRQVDAPVTAWRSGSLVEKRELAQFFLLHHLLCASAARRHDQARRLAREGQGDASGTGSRSEGAESEFRIGRHGRGGR